MKTFSILAYILIFTAGCMYENTHKTDDIKLNEDWKSISVNVAYHSIEVYHKEPLGIFKEYLFSSGKPAGVFYYDPSDYKNHNFLITNSEKDSLYSWISKIIQNPCYNKSISAFNNNLTISFTIYYYEFSRNIEYNYAKSLKSISPESKKVYQLFSRKISNIDELF